jgi:hypothetical protein
MIDYKYLTIASRATPIRSTGRAPDEKYFEKNEEENFEYIIGGKHQKIKLDISLPSGERIQELNDFGHCISQVKG